MPIGRALSENLLPESNRSRFAIAAAAAWAVLHLCGTPWLKGDIPYSMASDAIHLGLGATSEPELYFNPLVGVSSTLKSPSSAVLVGSTAGTPSAVSPSQSLIHNRMVFALGILLIELCLDSPLERTEQPVSQGSGQQPELGEAILYRRARRQLRDVMRRAGHTYAKAVLRCLECQRHFEGNADETSFQSRTFCQWFFDGVVAPVHAWWKLQQAIPLVR